MQNPEMQQQLACPCRLGTRHKEAELQESKNQEVSPLTVALGLTSDNPGPYLPRTQTIAPNPFVRVLSGSQRSARPRGIYYIQLTPCGFALKTTPLQQLRLQKFLK